MSTALPSVLYAGEAHPDTAQVPPTCLMDLNLDQVIAAVCTPRADCGLETEWWTPLADALVIADRQDVIRDIGRGQLHDNLSAFAAAMIRHRRCLSQETSLRHPLQRARWHLDAAQVYRDATVAVTGALAETQLMSGGLRRLRSELSTLLSTPAFRELSADIDRVARKLAGVRYWLHVTGNRIHVSRDGAPADLGASIARTFERFDRGQPPTQGKPRSHDTPMNHVESQILDQVADLFPEEFADLRTLCAAHPDIADPLVCAFDRDLQFFLTYLAFLQPLVDLGAPLCLPAVTHEPGLQLDGGFDLALAAKLAPTARLPVLANLTLDAAERAVVITGPNSGGKTTFARTIGQLHYLARLGLPVPGREARVQLTDHIDTHFQRGEQHDGLRGKLQDEIDRIHDTVDRATERSLVVLNEPFASTTVADAVILGSRVLTMLTERRSLAVCVTFLDDLSRADDVVSMVATVPPDNPSDRTFTVLRRPAEGTAHATAVAARYGLTYDQLTGAAGR